MSIILPSYQHCDASNNSCNTLMCTLHNFPSNKDRCIHTSTVTILHSCAGKKYAYALRASCFLYRNQYFLTFLRQNIQKKY